MNFKDSRGIKRGRCIACNECDYFENDPKNVNSCSYCSCTPSKHMRLDEAASTLEINSSQKSATSLLNEEEVSSISQLNSGGNFSDALILHRNNATADAHDLSDDTQLAGPSSARSDDQSSLLHRKKLQSSKNTQKSSQTCALCEQHTTLEYLIPNNYRTNLLTAIENGKVSVNQEAEIIRLIVSNMLQHDKSEQYHVKQVTVLLVQKFSFFKGAFESEHVGTSKRIHDTLKRQKQKTNNNSAKSKTDLLQEQCQIMKRELEKERGKNMDLVREILRSVRTLRQEDSKVLPASDMIQKYKALQYPELLKWEFCDINNNLKVTAFNKNWISAIPNILKKLPPTQRLNSNGQTIHLLLNLHSLFQTGNQKAESLLIIHKPGTTIKETQPAKDAPPFLTAISNPEDDSLTLCCYVDSCAISKAKATEAIPLLLCVYWIFGIKFKPAFKQELLLLSACVFREAATKLTPNLPKSLFVMKILKAAGIS